MEGGCVLSLGGIRIQIGTLSKDQLLLASCIFQMARQCHTALLMTEARLETSWCELAVFATQELANSILELQTQT
jgi:hypothetical protein